jgi:hypothetical protein
MVAGHPVDRPAAGGRHAAARIAAPASDPGGSPGEPVGGRGPVA